MLPQIKKPSSKPLKTPQSLVHIKHNMTLLQYKYWIVFLHHMRKQIDDGVEPDHRGYRYISTDELERFIGYKPKKIEIRADLKKLRSYPLEYNILEKDGKTTEFLEGFINGASVHTERIGYLLPYVLVEAMMGVEDAKQIFHLLNWDVFNSFSGKYEAIIYKLCKDYVGVKRTPYMTIQEYREYVGLKESEYSDKRDLIKFCVKKPIDAINESIVSDIRVSVDFEKQGRNIVGLRFLIEAKQMTIPIEAEAPKTDAFKLAKITIPTIEQKKYLEAMPEDEIQATIERANEYAETLTQKAKKANMGAIYQKAFTERWGVQYLEAKQAEKAEKTKLLEAKKSERTKTQTEAMQMQIEREETEQMRTVFTQLADDEKNAIQDTIAERINAYLKPSFDKERMKNKAHEKPQFAIYFKKILRDMGLIPPSKIV
jgi:hypothetical protein